MRRRRPCARAIASRSTVSPRSSAREELAAPARRPRRRATGSRPSARRSPRPRSRRCAPRPCSTRAPRRRAGRCRSRPRSSRRSPPGAAPPARPSRRPVMSRAISEKPAISPVRVADQRGGRLGREASAVAAHVAATSACDRAPRSSAPPATLRHLRARAPAGGSAPRGRPDRLLARVAVDRARAAAFQLVTAPSSPTATIASAEDSTSAARWRAGALALAAAR